MRLRAHRARPSKELPNKLIAARLYWLLSIVLADGVSGSLNSCPSTSDCISTLIGASRDCCSSRIGFNICNRTPSTCVTCDQSRRAGFVSSSKDGPGSRLIGSVSLSGCSAVDDFDSSLHCPITVLSLSNVPIPDNSDHSPQLRSSCISCVQMVNFLLSCVSNSKKLSACKGQFAGFPRRINCDQIRSSQPWRCRWPSLCRS